MLRQILPDRIKGYRPVITKQAVGNIGEMLKFAQLIERAPAFEEGVDLRYAPATYP